MPDLIVLGPPTTVNPAGPSSTQVIALPDGGFVTMWSGQTWTGQSVTGSYFGFQCYNADGQAVGSEYRLTGAVPWSFNSLFAASGADGFYVRWAEGSQKFTFTGMPTSPPTEPGYGGGPPSNSFDTTQHNLKSALLLDGTVVTGHSYWSQPEGNAGGGYMELRHPDGTITKIDLQTTDLEYVENMTFEALADGTFLAAWGYGSRGYGSNTGSLTTGKAQIFDAQGHAIGQQFNLDGLIPLDIRPISDGRFMILGGPGQLSSIVLGPEGSVIPVSEHLTFAGTTTELTVAENAAQAMPVLLEPGIALGDSAGKSYDGGALVVQAISGWEFSDQILIRSTGSSAGQIDVVGDMVRFGGTAFGTILVADHGLTIEFNAAATVPAIEALLRTLAFTPGSDDTGGQWRQLGLSITAGDGSSTGMLPLKLVVMPESEPGSAFGTTAGDTLIGTAAHPDALYGLAGNDSLYARGAGDQLYGGPGNDLLVVDHGSQQVYERVGAGTDTIASWVSFTLGRGQEIEVLRAASPDTSTTPINLTGNEFNQTIIGNRGDNVLSGGAGNDVLDGHGGTDTLIGGAGSDTYYVRDAGTRIIESPDENSSNTLYTSISYTLSEDLDIQWVIGLGADAINLTGDGLAQLMYGNDAANVLDGGGGSDQLRGLGGNDTLIGGSGNDALYGGSGDNRLEGGDDNDQLYGGSGRNVLIGGSGDDFFFVDSTSSSTEIVEAAGGGRDTVLARAGFTLTAGAEIEQLSGGGHLIGNEFSQNISGSAQSDVLEGGGGDDRLLGGLGNDALVGGEGVDTASYAKTLDNYRIGFSGGHLMITDMVLADDWETHIPDEGTDTLDGVEFANFAGVNVDLSYRTVFGDGGADVLANMSGIDLVYGLGGDDTLSGSVMDELHGGMGDDIYYVSESLIRPLEQVGNLWINYSTVLVVEAAGQGNDTIVTSSSFFLSPGQEIETLRTANPYSSAALSLRGNQFSQTIIGNAGDNQIYGDGGDDWIDGGTGRDVLQGGSGNDTYVVHDSRAQIGEYNFDAQDTVISWVDYTLSANSSIEILRAVDPTGSTTPLNLIGNEISQGIMGNQGNNLLSGGGGDDRLHGLGGNDHLDGGSGRDIAGYGGNFADFRITRDGTGWRVTDLNAADGDEGTDTLTGVEYLHFADQDYHLI
jgi:Ca2+-binding RTX toxin-like protein